ncbi:MAG: NAD(+) diphosphatase [Synergistaceae bacterium]|nr:NAD(+) diphosphatase [Synergistaceae bacterium]
MIVFCKDEILVKGSSCNLSEQYLLTRKGTNITKISRNLPESWQNLQAWAEVDSLDRLAPDEKLFSIRDLLAAGDADTQRAVSCAWQFRNWFRDVKFCSHCGGELHPSKNDYGRICEKCETVFYAPLSPAVITAIEYEGRLLLAHNRNWYNNRVSVIAGFVEPGENLEDAVRREIREEVSIEVKNLKYFGSQTWPMPNSLMLAFTAEYDSGEVVPDGKEITYAGFFSPADIVRMNIPDRGSIARRLIENFLQTH